MKTILEFKNSTRPIVKADKKRKKNTFKSINAFYQDRESVLNAFKSRILPIKSTQGKGIKTLTPDKMLYILPTALAQVKAGNTSNNFLNEICQIIYSLY